MKLIEDIPLNKNDIVIQHSDHTVIYSFKNEYSAEEAMKKTINYYIIHNL